ncbi:flavin reductase family protein [Micromonospora rhizosphaerae]|nr:flavin reductase family protein [Micromonospora rhizosphaerae]
MRRLVTGVTIITATYKSRPWGMTVSAFTPVCAEPPTVLICLNRNTVLAGAVQTGGRFGVNLLSQDQEFLSRLCSRPGMPKYLDDYCLPSEGASAPLLYDSLAAFDCDLDDARVVGSHMVLIGLVSGVFIDGSRRPLLYGAGRYHEPIDFDATSRLGGQLAWS